jgi:hypothetical protein
MQQTTTAYFHYKTISGKWFVKVAVGESPYYCTSVRRKDAQLSYKSRDTEKIKKYLLNPMILTRK